MTKQNTYEFKIQTLNFDQGFKKNVDIFVQESAGHEFDRTTFVTITDEYERILCVRFDWCNLSTTEHEFAALIIPETDKLFFGSKFYYGIIDLKLKKIDVIENCTLFWNFEKHSNTIVVITELLALSLNLNGDVIDKVPIDPPFESKFFNDRIEFQSLVCGRQVLKLMK